MTVNAFLPPQIPNNIAVGGVSREKQIVDALGLDRYKLSQVECEQLIATVLDLFALTPFELGATDLVAHSIDTGDSPPIRQPARRTPFAEGDRNGSTNIVIYHPQEGQWAALLHGLRRTKCDYQVGRPSLTKD